MGMLLKNNRLGYIEIELYLKNKIGGYSAAW